MRSLGSRFNHWLIVGPSPRQFWFWFTWGCSGKQAADCQPWRVQGLSLVAPLVGLLSLGQRLPAGGAERLPSVWGLKSSCRKFYLPLLEASDPPCPEALPEQLGMGFKFPSEGSLLATLSRGSDFSFPPPGQPWAQLGTMTTWKNQDYMESQYPPSADFSHSIASFSLFKNATTFQS